MDRELWERLNTIEAKIDRIRQILGDNTPEEALNEIFGEIPEENTETEETNEEEEEPTITVGDLKKKYEEEKRVKARKEE